MFQHYTNRYVQGILSHMDGIQRIFDEYVHLRLNGLESSEAINVLHIHINQLDDDMRNELGMSIRAWEVQRSQDISDDDNQKLTIRQSQDTIECPHCGKPNSASEVICYSCGGLLKNLKEGTDLLPPKTGELLNDALFTVNNVLILIADEDTSFTLRPHMGASRLTIGRHSENAPVDVNLEPLSVNQGGVSRLHATIIYNDDTQTLSLLDMNSTNGSFINEQRLHPKERRVIRHGDQLRFGRVSLRVVYKNETH